MIFPHTSSVYKLINFIPLIKQRKNLFPVESDKKYNIKREKWLKKNIQKYIYA